MKPFFALLALLLSVSPPTFAQPSGDASSVAVGTADAQEAFDSLKSLAGSWVGRLTVTPESPEFAGRLAQISMRVTSLGNALAHEMSVSGIPDHPLTVFYLDADNLSLTHYCDAGNRPHMVGTVSPDGKTVEFDLVDLSGSDAHGHMHHVVFTFIDKDHHTEDWTYMMPGDKPVLAHFDLQRTHAVGNAAAY